MSCSIGLFNEHLWVFIRKMSRQCNVYRHYPANLNIYWVCSIFSNSGEECVREGRRGWQSPRGTQSQSQSPRPLKGSWGRGRPTVEVQRPTFEEHTWAGQKFAVEVQSSHLTRTLQLSSLQIKARRLTVILVKSISSTQQHQQQQQQQQHQQQQQKIWEQQDGFQV